MRRSFTRCCPNTNPVPIPLCGPFGSVLAVCLSCLRASACCCRLANNLLACFCRLLLRALFSASVSLAPYQSALWRFPAGVLSVRSCVTVSFQNCYLWTYRIGLDLFDLVHHTAWRPRVWSNHHRRCCGRWHLVGWVAGPDRGLTPPQCRNRRWPVNNMATPRASASSMTS